MSLTKIQVVGRRPRAARRMLPACAGLAFLGVLVPACGVANPSGQQAAPANADGSPDVDEAAALSGGGTSYEVLHELSVADAQTLTFILLSRAEAGPDEIIISDQFRNVDHYSALTDRHGYLTTLETFLAFAPQGVEPHPALVAAHDSEARGLGRGDGKVKLVDGLEPEVEKVTLPECESRFFYNGDGIRPLVWRVRAANIQVTIDDLDFFGCVGEPQVTGLGNPTGCELYGPEALLRMFACNDTNSFEPMASKFFTEGVGDVFEVNVQPGTTRRVTRLPFQPPPGQPVIARKLALRIRNGNGTGVIIGGMASL